MLRMHTFLPWFPQSCASLASGRLRQDDTGCVPPFTHSIFTRTAWLMRTSSPCTVKGKPLPLLVPAVPWQLSSPALCRWHMGGAAQGGRGR